VTASQDVENVLLDEEKSLAFELGSKWAVGGSTLEANVFYTKIDGFQEQVNAFLDAALVSTATNIDELETSGFELTAYGDLMDGLSYNVGYIYNKVEYPNGSTGDDGFDLSGEQYLYAPEHKLTVSGEYRRNVIDNVDGFVNLNAVYKSDLRLAPIEVGVFDAHTTIGGAIGIADEDGAWTLSVFGRNLTQEREPISYLPQPFPDGAVRSWPQAGITTRLIGVKLDVNF